MNRPPPQQAAPRQPAPPRASIAPPVAETLIAERLRLAQAKRDRKAAERAGQA